MIRPLCASVDIYPDESLLSVIARTADANVVPNTATLLRQALGTAGRTASTPLTQFNNAKEIAALFNSAPDQINARMFPPADGAPVTSINWFGTPLERRFLEARKRRYAPSALSVAPYGRSSWQIRPLLYCPQTFERLQDTCGSCGSQLGWDRALGIAVCERCEARLENQAPILDEVDQADYRTVAGLVDVCPEVRRMSLARLAEPFSAWRAGDTFAAVVELGSIAANSSSNDHVRVGRELIAGDFSSLGDRGLLLGLKLVRDWPHAFDELVLAILRPRTKQGSNAKFLGPLARLWGSSANRELSELVRDRVSLALNRLNVPLKQISGSKLLGSACPTHLSMLDAEREFRIGSKLLRRAALDGDCLVGRSEGRTGVHRFDRTKLGKAASLMASAKTKSKFAAELGIPAYVVPTMVESGLIDDIEDLNVRAMVGNRLLDPTSVDEFLKQLKGFPTAEAATELVSLAVALRTDLSPYVWSTAFQAMLAGELPTFVVKGDCGLAEQLFCAPKRLHECLKAPRSLPLPAIQIPAVIASRIIGFNQGVIGQAVQVGMLKRGRHGFLLSDLDDFRRAYVSPSEISEWFAGSGHCFATLMAEAGVEPVANLYKVNIWQRSNVEAVFGAHITRDVYWIRSEEA